MLDLRTFAVIFAALLTANCGGNTSETGLKEADSARIEAGNTPDLDRIAPGAPGDAPFWSNAEKVGIGTSYEAYDENGQFSDDGPTGPISKVWFSLGKDRITEVMWGLIHEAQIREIRFVVVGPEGILEPTGTEVITDGGVRPTSPANGIGLMFDQIDRSVLFTTFTDPDRDSLIVKVDMTEPLPEGYALFAYIDPAIGNTGTGDKGRMVDSGLHAFDGDSHMFAMTSGSTDGGTIGFAGVSDGLSDIGDGALDTSYNSTGDTVGNVAGLLPIQFANSEAAAGIMGPEAKLVIGFGEGFNAAKANAAATFEADALSLYGQYADQWQGYLASLEDLPRIAEASTDGGALAYMSAINLKIMEDKTHAGALIASLSNPWGETFPADTSQTGYKAVWPRDFFQVASAFLAMGDEETALAAYRYLPKIQVTEDTPGNKGVTGWFLQKTHVDGEIEWVAIQQDQTAMPIMLGYKLWQAGVIGDEEMAASYRSMLKPAADFLVEGGKPAILWNVDEFEASLGYTQQERWEEQEGYSPSTVAAVIGGLVTAGELATRFGDEDNAMKYFAAADELEANVENWMFTTTGELSDGEYFIRITRNQDPNDKALLGDNNGRPGLPEDQIIDGGFLELVRYGVRAAKAPSIQATIDEYLDKEIEHNLRVNYTFREDLDIDQRVGGFRRYGNDGYGEDGERGTNYHEIDGGNTPGQRGRVWPFFSGEYAHYALQHAEEAGPFGGILIDIAKRSVFSMESFANEGLSLPEQVWDGVGPNPFEYELGEGTNSATPLAWTHAEYIKLLRSIADGAVWDRYDVVAERYADSPRNVAE
jgi:glucoamylase